MDMKTSTKKPVLRWTGCADDEMVADYMENYNSNLADKYEQEA